jgi:hypothetical protein
MARPCSTAPKSTTRCDGWGSSSLAPTEVSLLTSNASTANGNSSVRLAFCSGSLAETDFPSLSLLADLITNTMNAGGSVLVPTDPSARLLELLVLLESHWNFANLGQRFPLCLISRTGRDVVGFVRSLTEWMGGQIGGEAGGEKVLKFV